MQVAQGSPQESQEPVGELVASASPQEWQAAPMLGPEVAGCDLDQLSVGSADSKTLSWAAADTDAQTIANEPDEPQPDEDPATSSSFCVCVCVFLGRISCELVAN